MYLFGKRLDLFLELFVNFWQLGEFCVNSMWFCKFLASDFINLWKFLLILAISWHSWRSCQYVQTKHLNKIRQTRSKLFRLYWISRLYPGTSEFPSIRLCNRPSPISPFFRQTRWAKRNPKYNPFQSAPGAINLSNSPIIRLAINDSFDLFWMQLPSAYACLN